MSETEWQILKGVLPRRGGGTGRPLAIGLRAIVNAIFYVVRNGCAWANLPKGDPNPNSVYYHYRKWRKDGTWQNINEGLRRQARQSGGRQPEASAAIIDSQSTKPTQAGGVQGYDAGKQVKGRKRHILVDTLGHLIEVVVHAADSQDRDGAKLLLAKLSEDSKACLPKLWADGGYAGQLVTWVRHHLEAVLDIVKRDPALKGFAGLPRRWVVDDRRERQRQRTFAWSMPYSLGSKTGTPPPNTHNF